jgi:hypothetical protein
VLPRLGPVVAMADTSGDPGGGGGGPVPCINNTGTYWSNYSIQGLCVCATGLRYYNTCFGYGGSMYCTDQACITGGY